MANATMDNGTEVLSGDYGTVVEGNEQSAASVSGADWDTGGVSALASNSEASNSAAADSAATDAPKKGRKAKAIDADKSETTDLIPAFGQAITRVPGVGFSEVGLHFPEGTTREQWASAGKALDTVGNAQNWWRGDWYIYGQDNFEGFAQEFDGSSEQTIANIASVCRRVPAGIRRSELSYRHHEAVAKVKDPEKQAFLLNIAVVEKLNSDAFRKRVSDIDNEANKNVPVSDGGETGEGQPGQETVGQAEVYVANTRQSILSFIRANLDWQETQLLMLDLRDLLSEQGIVVDIDFQDDDMQAALASRAAAPMTVWKRQILIAPGWPFAEPQGI